MKHPKKDEMVIMAVCQRTGQPYGITAERVGRDFHFKWAFKLSASSAKREGFDKNRVSGNIFDDAEFPGCPHCGADTWYQCGGCRKFVCHRSGDRSGKCPSCGNQGEIVTADSFDLSGGSL